MGTEKKTTKGRKDKKGGGGKRRKKKERAIKGVGKEIDEMQDGGRQTTESRTRHLKVRQRQTNCCVQRVVRKSLDDLSADLLVAIARHLDGFMLPVLSFVSRRWRTVHARLRRERRQRVARMCEDGMPNVVMPTTARKRATRYAKALIAGHHLPLLMWACAAPNAALLPKYACHAAALAGDLAVLEWIYERQNRLGVTFPFYAVAGGNTAVIEWSIARDCDLTQTAWSGAALIGRMDLIEWLDERVDLRDARAMACAALGGRLDVTEPFGLSLGLCFSLAKLRPHVARVASRRPKDYERIIEWLIERGCPSRVDSRDWAAMAAGCRLAFTERMHVKVVHRYGSHPCKVAARAGRLEVLQWLREKRVTWDARVTEWAAMGGHFDVLDWLHTNGCPSDASASEAAAVRGRLDVLQWLHEHGIALSKRICYKAARAGSVEMMEWLREHGHTWGASACEAAARDGHLPLLQWLHREGCLWTPGACERAASGGHLDVLRWAHAQDLDWHERHCATAAAWAGHLAVLKWIAEVAAAPDASDASRWRESLCLGAATGGHLDVLWWLQHDAKCPWDRDACRAAAVCRHRTDVVAWIDAQPSAPSSSPASSKHQTCNGPSTAAPLSPLFSPLQP